MAKFCPETKETVLSQDCVECTTKACRKKKNKKDQKIDKKKHTFKPELRL